MKNPFSGLFRARDKPGRRTSPKDAVSGATTFSFGMAGSGKSVNARTAIQVSAVYACVRVIAETVASLPFSVFEQDKTGSQKALDHPLYRILHDEPNTEMTSFVWREAMLTHLLLWGNSYSQILRAGRGNIVGLYPLLPDHMEVDRDDKGKLTYTYSTTNGQTVKLRPEDVLHIPGLGFDGIMGYSPIAIERNAVGLSIAAEEFGGKFFGNGATPSGILTHPNTVKNPKALRESWMEAYGGSSNANRVAILEEGILSSVKEYRRALMHLQKDPESVAARRIVQREERFYYSDWFAVLTNLEPSYLIRKMKEMIAERGGAECTSAGISLTNVREP